jgi:hypothetical protein
MDKVELTQRLRIVGSCMEGYATGQTAAAAVRYIEALEAENAALRAQVAHLESLIADIATVAGRDTPDAIDNEGQPYQSAALATVIERTKR